MTTEPDKSPNASDSQDSASVEAVRRRAPSWIPGWMSERERCACIIAIGIVVASVVVAIGSVVAAKIHRDGTL